MPSATRSFRTRPKRAFERVRIVGDMAYVSGHGPTDEHGKVLFEGRLGADLTTEQGYEAARRVAAACLGSLQEALGDLDWIDQVVKLLAFVNSARDFDDQPLVANGFTDLFLEAPRRSRAPRASAIGTEQPSRTTWPSRSR